MSAAAPANDTLTRLFLDMLAAERGAGANTLDAYRRDLADLAAFLGTHGIPVHTADLLPAGPDDGLCHAGECGPGRGCYRAP